MGQCPLCGTPKAHVLANIVPPHLTEFASLARLADFKRHTISYLKRAFCILPESTNSSGRFVAKYEWLFYQDVSIAIVSVVVKIATTDAS
jgi:hypothetical protein